MRYWSSILYWFMLDIFISVMNVILCYIWLRCFDHLLPWCRFSYLKVFMIYEMKRVSNRRLKLSRLHFLLFVQDNTLAVVIMSVYLKQAPCTLTIHKGHWWSFVAFPHFQFVILVLMLYLSFKIIPLTLTKPVRWQYIEYSDHLMERNVVHHSL